MRLNLLFTTLFATCALALSGQRINLNVNTLESSNFTGDFSENASLAVSGPLLTIVDWEAHDFSYVSFGQNAQARNFPGGFTGNYLGTAGGNLYAYSSSKIDYYNIANGFFSDLSLPGETFRARHEVPVILSDQVYARKTVEEEDEQHVQLFRVGTARSTLLFTDSIGLNAPVPRSGLGADGTNLFMTRTTDGTGEEVWKYETETGELSLVADAIPGNQTPPGVNNSSDIVLSSFPGYVVARYNNNYDTSTVVISRGNQAPLVKSLDSPSDPILMGEKLLFSGAGSLYTVDLNSGTEETLAEVGEATALNVTDRYVAFLASRGDSTALYRTDGTRAGTELVHTFPEEITRDVGVANGLFGFVLENGSLPDRNLYVYNPENNDIALINMELPHSLVTLNDKFYFFGSHRGGGRTVHFLEQERQINLTGNVFHDLNENGVRDANEPGLENFAVRLASGDTTYRYSFIDGGFRASLAPRNDYNITVLGDGCWVPTTVASEDLRLEPDSVYVQHYGFKLPENGPPAISVRLTAGTPRCGFVGTYWLTVINDGCVELGNTVTKLTLPPELIFIDADTTYASLVNGVVSWERPSLRTNQQWRTRLRVQMPDENFVDTLISLEATVSSLIMGGNTEVNGSATIADALRCAIDPNDKQVTPRRPEPSNSNYTQFDETLTYTVRFQNTGNDTAFTVRIEDQLSTDLDPETFKPLTASHPYVASLTEDGIAIFLFEDILLPDSTTNEPESHGFVTFEVRTKTGLEDFTAIDNTAGIFFDFNEPIITNTVTSTLVEFLDEDMDDFFFWDECDDKNENAFPGAPEILGNGIDEDCNGWDETVSTLNPLPGKLEVFPNPTRNVLQLRYDQNTQLQGELISMRGRRMQSFVFQRTLQLNLSNLPTGVYLLRLTDVRSGAMRVEKINIHR